MTRNFVKGEGYDLVIKLAKADGSQGKARETTKGMSGAFSADEGATVLQGPDDENGNPTAHVTASKAGNFNVHWNGFAAEEGADDTPLQSVFVAAFSADQTVVATAEVIEPKASRRHHVK